MSAPTDSNVPAVAEDAYVFGYPLVLMDLTRQVMTNATTATSFQAPTNQFCLSPLPTPDNKAVVRPNVDTLYATAWLDLGPEPMVLSVPPMTDRYWLMQILDNWTNTTHDPSSTNTAATDVPLVYVITGPGWTGSVPNGTTQLAMPTDTAWIAGRIEVHDDADQANAQDLQKQLGLVPLSDWNSGSYTPPDGVFDPSIDMVTATDQQIAALRGRDFFNRLCGLLAVNPTTPDDAAAMAEFATVGIVPGGNVYALSDADLDAAAAAGQARIQGHTGPDPVNGWRFATTDIGAYGTAKSVANAVEYAQRLALYPYNPDGSTTPTVWTDVLDQPYNAAIRYDTTFFGTLNTMVQAEPWLDRDRALIDQLASLGMKQGTPYAPDADTTQILATAVADAHTGSTTATGPSSTPPTGTAPTGPHRPCRTWSTAPPPASPSPTPTPSTTAASPTPSASSPPATSAPASPT
ncbi:DUF1254 domain-containing protein [Kitasatospora sp. NPDC059673]|uniref:DUF1254 domain-containing protein n=1 Tax=Kitasatospora sp. NPDC059673 TaxID=3346901 RepID=UPI003696F9FD